MLISSRKISIAGVRCYCFINMLNLTSSTRSICRAISQYTNSEKFASICNLLRHLAKSVKFTEIRKNLWIFVRDIYCLEHMKFTVSYFSVYFQRHHTVWCKALAQKHYFDSTWTYLFVKVIHRKCLGGALKSLRQQLLNTSFSAPWQKFSGFGLRSRDLIEARLKSFVYFNIYNHFWLEVFHWDFDAVLSFALLRATRICTIDIRRYQHDAREHKITWHEHWTYG